jgi:hypothetical protein
MNKAIRHFFATLAFVLLAGCGGGSGGTPATVASKETFNLSQAWVNYLTTTQSLPFSVQGTIYGESVSGNGTLSQSGLQAATFENAPAQRKSGTATLRIVVDRQSTDLAVTTAMYVDSNYRPLGSQGEDYAVVFNAVNIPSSARVGDNGIWYTERTYPSSAKLYSTGTKTTAFTVEPDTASTALLKIISTDYSSGGSQTSSTIATFRMTTAGTLTRLNDSTVSSEGTLTFTY